MKWVNPNADSVALGAVGGILVGAGIGYLVASRRLQRRFDLRLDAEVESVKEHYQQRALELTEADRSSLGWPPSNPDSKSSSVGRALADAVEADSEDPGDDNDLAEVQRRFLAEHGAKPVIVETQDGPVEVSGLRLPIEAAGPLEGIDDGEDYIEPADVVVAEVTPKDRDTSKPYIMSYEEFADPPVGHQQITVTFYAADKVLTDDQDQPVPNHTLITGEFSALSFGGVSKDPHVLYIRNEERDIDFEIILNAGSYADAILNYGRPEKEE